MTFPTELGRVVGPAIVSGPTGTWQSAAGRVDNLFLEELGHYSQVLHHPKLTPEMIGATIAELEALKLRESGALAAMSKWVESRAGIVDGLLAKLQLAGAMMEDADGERLRGPGTSRSHIQQQGGDAPSNNQKRREGGDDDGDEEEEEES